MCVFVGGGGGEGAVKAVLCQPPVICRPLGRSLHSLSVAHFDLAGKKQSSQTKWSVQQVFSVGLRTLARADPT